LVISATLLAAADSMALPPFPLVLTVVGRGAIHVRVAEGRVAPCDSFSDRPVLDQWLRAGTSQTFSINDACVCVDHTWGSFREREWSPGRVICGASPSRRSPLPNPVERLVISTDQP
jgi:hypothetical protein